MCLPMAVKIIHKIYQMKRRDYSGFLEMIYVSCLDPFFSPTSYIFQCLDKNKVVPLLLFI